MNTSRSFAEVLTPAPEVLEAEGAEIARAMFGVTGPVRSLGSQTDANLVVGEEGQRFLLKIANPSSTVAELEAQSLAAAHVGGALDARRAGIAVPRTVPAADGSLVQTVELAGRPLQARLLEFVEGTPLSGDRYLSPAVVAEFGRFAALAVLSLADFAHPGTHRELEWDLRQARRLVDDLLPYVDDPELAEQVRRAADEAWARVSELDGSLPRQVIHGDITDDNVVGATDAAGRLMPHGIIDFGDVVHSWTVAELAVSCSGVLHHHGAGPTSVLPAVRAFHELRPLAEAEAEALWPLVVLRAATLVVSAHHAAATDPGNDYTRANAEHEHVIFEVATSVPLRVMTGLVRVVCGFEVAASGGLPAVEHPLLPGVSDAGVSVVDLGALSERLAGGRFADEGVEGELAAETLRGGVDADAGAGATVALARFGERRLTRSFLESGTAHPCAALGVELWFAELRTVAAPWAGAVSREGERMLLAVDGVGIVELEGLDPAAGSDGAVAAAGDVLGQASHLRIRVLRPGVEAGAVPWFVTSELAPGWETLVADPTPLLGSAVPGSPVPGDHAGAGRAHPSLLERREQSLAEVQEHYYDAPPEIERGWRHHLFDTEARPYLDMVNNVASVGHAHPRIVSAVTRQLNLLNTNSRFNYASIVEFSERLAGMLPDPLDTVFFVNSGTEAVDLALRISWAWTGRRDVVAVREAYHGWSDAADAVSTSVADNPQALSTRPPWVHTLDAPNSYRGRYRGDDSAHLYAADAVAAIEALVAAGQEPATCIAEAFYGNAGGMPLPEGYLEAVYGAVRSAGGLCIADEVQVGYGRLGSHLWGFEQQGVVPDIVTVAKAMGNGHPLGAVITSRAVADAYRSQGYFFSSAGGSPVSSVVGLAVLDIIRDEGLQENARVVGGYLKSRLEGLMPKHPLIGAVHGLGLYLGVELVRDRGTLEPATEETAALCERMRELGVIVQPTSDRQCVLKIKPPLTLTRSSADFFVDTLDEVLSTGW
ncbi:aminotransferase [Herbiconiux sp. KACC 21604]|uniref:aminotransferase n=1 Tax=unclassified Herbiconiux TaxID=2618217 RepID=UPI001492FE4B|nr:aminotransferase [Herbiconiux sp. SALV-R1]QJU52500.1 aminotransferase [Herbiconiux sp. SALV-R1]WPO87376.1 aminotransferase [Herbiconiux sp. KACC 21604]